MVFRLKTARHESFERSGSNLLTNVKITLSEALLGFSRILVKHLDGRGVNVSSPPGKIIQPGDSIKLRGEGMPTYKNPDQKGDLFIVLNIEMPDAQWLQSVDKPVCCIEPWRTSTDCFCEGVRTAFATEETKHGPNA